MASEKPPEMTYAEITAWADREGCIVVSKHTFDQLCTQVEDLSAQVATAIMAEADAAGELEAFLR
jgi:outer membrane murein-binding lipoprotein Lpp